MGKTKVCITGFLLGILMLSSCSFKADLKSLKNLNGGASGSLPEIPATGGFQVAYFKPSLCSGSATVSAGCFRIKQSCSQVESRVLVTGNGYKVFEGSQAQNGGTSP